MWRRVRGGAHLRDVWCQVSEGSDNQPLQLSGGDAEPVQVLQSFMFVITLLFSDLFFIFFLLLRYVLFLPCFFFFVFFSILKEHLPLSSPSQSFFLKGHPADK